MKNLKKAIALCLSLMLILFPCQCICRGTQ